MNIIDRIESKKFDYIQVTGHGPINLYLGHEEMLELYKATLDSLRFRANTDNTDKTNRFKACGLYCFKVNANHHLECS